MRRCPKVYLQWDFDCEDTIRNIIENILNELNDVYSQIGDLNNDDISVDTVYKPTEIGLYRHLVSLRNVHFLHRLSNCNVTTQRYSDFPSDQIIYSVLYSSLNRRDVFLTLLKFNKKYSSSRSSKLRRWITKLLTLGNRFSDESSDDHSIELNALEFIVEDMQKALQINRTLFDPFIALTLSETNGLCSSFLQRFDRNDYAYIILLDHDNFNHIISTAHNPDTRKKVFLTYYRETDDTFFVKKLLKAEQDYAKQLGYENSAEMLFSSNILKEKSMKRLYEHLSCRLSRALKRKRKGWLKQKRLQCARFGYQFNEKLDLWDIDYCQHTSGTVSYDKLSQQLSNYFSLGHVVVKLLSMYDTLLCLKTSIVFDFSAWHQSVLTFGVQNAMSGNKLIGYICLDLLSRNEKRDEPPYCYVLQPGFNSLLQKRHKKITVVAVVSSFEGSPSYTNGSGLTLISHKEMESLCRSIGSAFQAVCNRPPYTFYNTVVMEKDILGVMGKFWNNFAWEPEILRFLSCHYTSGKPIPDQLLVDLCKVRYDQDIFKVAVSVYNGIIDLKLRQEANDLDMTKRTLYKHIFGLKYSKYLDFTVNNFSVISLPFSRLYHYDLWCQILSDDLFQSLKNNLSSPTIGFELRTKILKPFGSVNPYLMFKSFLGRKPNHKAFLKVRNL